MEQPKTLRKTGFEGKPTRVVLENWLYNTEDLDLLADSTLELRRRFVKAFPRPDWAPKPKEK